MKYMGKKYIRGNIFKGMTENQMSNILKRMDLNSIESEMETAQDWFDNYIQELEWYHNQISSEVGDDE